MIIRPEVPQDTSAIQLVTVAAFAGRSYSSQNEHLIVNALREAGALFISLVAEIDGQVIGHVAFSGVTINGINNGWYGSGPVSVLPGFQRQGIGSQLVRGGLSQLRESGARGCVLEGSPAYYQRFGFTPHPGLMYEGAPSPDYFMALPFHDGFPE